MGSLWDIAEKEVRDSFSSKRFILLLLLFLGFALGSVYLGIDQYQQQMDRFTSGDPYGHVPEKPSLVEVFEPMLGFRMPLAAGILALLLSYNAISGERESGTIELLLSYPVYRDEVINGKFIAGIFTLAVALLFAFVGSSGLAIYLTGELPTLVQVTRIWSLWVGSIIYLGCILSLGMLCSTLFRSSWRALIVGAAVLAVFMATPLAGQFVAGHLYPYPDYDRPVDLAGHGRVVASGDARAVQIQGSTSEDTESRERLDERERRVQQRNNLEAQRRIVREQRQQFEETVSKLTPTTSYQRYLDTMLGTNYNVNNGTTPTLAESLSSALGYLLFLISQTVALFTLSYAAFMRQDL